MKIAAALIILLPSTALAGSSLPLQMAREKGFIGCDAAITKVFENSGSGDVRSNISVFPDTKSDSIKLSVTSGSAGDSVYVEAEFRKQAGKCYATQTVILATEKNCMAYKEDVPAFKFVAQSSDFTWTSNPGGVNLLLKPVGGGCLAIFQLDVVK